MLTDILLLCTGLIAGIMNAIAGGGGLVSFPVLLALGLPALTANATSYVTVLPGQITAAWGYRSYLRNVPKIYLWLLLPCAAGAAIGSHLLRETSFGSFEKVVPWLIVLAVLLFSLQPILRSHFVRHLRSKRKAGWKLGVIGLALFIMTIYGGYFGAGFGFVLLALIGFGGVREIHTMNGMKNVAAIVVVAVAILGVSSAHIIHWQYGLTVAVGNLLGGYAGARLAQKVPSHLIRVIVIIIGITTAGYLAWRYR